MKARKKPVVVDCFKYKGYNSLDPMYATEMPPLWVFEAVGKNIFKHYIEYPDGSRVYWHTIDTLEGEMRISDGDYIIKGVNGELYPCKPDIFEKTYDILPDQEEENE